MQVDIWSDVVCPWCYLGKRRFEAALARFPHREQVQVAWRAFELDPDAPPEHEGGYAGRLASKYGTTVEAAEDMTAQMTATAAAEGLAFSFDRARPGNTRGAHRLLHLAALRGRQDELCERLFHACFVDGEPIGLTATLVRLGTEVGLDRDEVWDVVNGDAYADAVLAEESAAADLGIRGVPFFVIDRRYAVSGAQPTEVLLQALEQAWAERPLLVPASAGGVPDGVGADGAAEAGCEGDSCAV